MRVFERWACLRALKLRRLSGSHRHHDLHVGAHLEGVFFARVFESRVGQRVLEHQCLEEAHHLHVLHFGALLEGAFHPLFGPCRELLFSCTCFLRASLRCPEDRLVYSSLAESSTRTNASSPL